MEKNQFLRVGVTGLGVMGSRHADDILQGNVPGLQLTAVADAIPGRAQSFAEGKSGVSAYEDTETMIASGVIEALIIATPHFSHTTLGASALKAGLHVLVEKPISVHKADCEILEAAHSGTNRVFAAMFNMRTDPKYIKIKQLIDSGELGRINRMSWIVTDWFRTEAYYRSGDWRATWTGEGGGVLLNQCPHQLDLWQWFFGMPKHIRAFCQFGRFHDIEVEDDVTAFMEYENGATGIFVTTTGESPGTNRLEIAGEKGRLVLENGRIEFIRNDGETSTFARETDLRFARPDVWEVHIPYPENTQQHRDILINFANACLKGDPVIAPATEGKHSVELGNAMLLSTWENRTVDLPMDGALFASHLQQRMENSRYKPQSETS
jgi:predicted dehydrogenase